MKSDVRRDNAFVVHVARLRRAPGRRWDEVRRGLVGAGELATGSSSADTSVPERTTAVAEVALEAFDGGVMVTGTVRAPWVGVCARCTAAVEGIIEAAVRERFTEPGGRYGDCEDDEAYEITDDNLDLWPMVRDAVVLALPMAPLCRPGCQGLCASCGADRNVESCECGQTPDPRWANLDVLRSTP